MSVYARSLGSAGRPVFGRSVAAAVVALIAMFAVGAPAALADEIPSPGETAVDVPVAPPTEPVDPPPVDPPAVDPPPVDPPPVDPPAVDPPPADPPAVDPPPVDPPAAAQSAPSPAPAATPSPPETGSAAPAPAPTPSPRDSGPEAGEEDSRSSDGPDDGPPGNARSVAQNVNRVIQAVWQVQRGCRSHCYGTSQSQRSVQWSQTTQSATAVSGGSNAGGSSAEARNESSTIQFVWQMQIGCVAFCFHTSQTQDASQDSYTSQEAVAESALTAWAENLAQTVQYVFQHQEGCDHECHGVSQSQTVSQTQSTSQSANASAGQDAEAGPALGDDGSVLLPDWLIAYALNIGATIQTVYQYQEALCLEHCSGDTQLQEAAQRAETTQRAVAQAAPPPAPAEPPPTEPPPVDPPPTEQPPSAGQQPGTGPAAEAGVSTADRRVGRIVRSTARQRLTLRRQPRRSVRRQELTFQAVLPALGGGPIQPAASGQAGAGTGSPAVESSAKNNRKETGKVLGEQRPANTFAAPSAPTPGGSMGWLVIALLAAALASLIGLRRGLASDLNRI
jgi:hypothetical protein